MRCQHLGDFVNGFGKRLAEFFMLKVSPHPVDNALPELFAALVVNRFVTDNSEFVCSWCYKNKDAVALPRFVHCEMLKFLLGNHYRIGVEFSALNIDTYLAGSF